MFTGIVEEVGQVKSFIKEKNGAKLTIAANTVIKDLKIGDSIAVNGVCQTVTDFDNSSFTVIESISHNSSIIAASGKDLPLSHFETALSVIPSFSARLLCVNPTCFLHSATNAPIFI